MRSPALPSGPSQRATWAGVPVHCSCRERWASHQVQACECDLPALRGTGSILSRHDQDIFPKPRIPETFNPPGERDEPRIVNMREVGVDGRAPPNDIQEEPG